MRVFLCSFSLVDLVMLFCQTYRDRWIKNGLLRDVSDADVSYSLGAICLIMKAKPSNRTSAKMHTHSAAA